MLNHDERESLAKRAKRGLEEVLDFFAIRATDPNGGFFGKVDRDLQPVADAERSLVFTARMLWTYAAAYRILQQERWLRVARHALDSIETQFLDPVWGGGYWGVRADGSPAQDRKYVYGQSFLIYGGAELMRACGDERGLRLAKTVYALLEEHCSDKVHGGYFETYRRDWVRIPESFNIPDPALGSKALNTHLHLIESYTNLMRVWDDKDLHAKVGELIQIMSSKLLDTETYHYKPYMTDDWGVTRSLFSYGHDIEGAWLLVEAAQAHGDAGTVRQCIPIAVRIAEACAQALDPESGGMYAENVEGHVVRDMVWWVQAEAVVGFLNAYELTGEEKYLDWMYRVWDYIDKHVVDREGGIYREWLSDAALPADHPKNRYPINGWKTPYHNGRMYMEVLERLEHWEERQKEFAR